MKNSKYIIPLLTAALLLSSCSSSGSTNYASDASYKSGASENYAAVEEYNSDDVQDESYKENSNYDILEKPANIGNNNSPVESAKMIYTATVTLETLEYDDTVSKIRAEIDSLGGFTERSSEQNNNKGWYQDNYSRSEDRTFSITARVPSENFNKFLEDLSSYGQKMYESTNAENVSRQYADNEAQIKALEAEQDRLLQMMGSAVTIEDMITVEERITNVQSQLNQLRTTLSGLDSQIRYSTINLEVYEVHKYTEIVTEPAPEPTFLERLGEHIKDSGESFLEVLEGLLYILIALFPYLIIAGIIAAVIISARKKKKAKEVPVPAAVPVNKPEQKTAPAYKPQDTQADVKQDTAADTTPDQK